MPKRELSSPTLTVDLWCGNQELYYGELGELLAKARDEAATPDTSVAKVTVRNNNGRVAYSRRFHYIALMDKDRTPRALPALAF